MAVLLQRAKSFLKKTGLVNEASALRCGVAWLSIGQRKHNPIELVQAAVENQVGKTNRDLMADTSNRQML